MQDVFLLSELHPYKIGKLRFNPFDPLQQLIAQSFLQNDRAFQRQVFLDRISLADKVLRNSNKIPVIRDHTHSDYLTQQKVGDIKSKTSLLDVLAEQYSVLSVLTVRNPLDSYISLRTNGWATAIHSFDDYCSRVVLMLDAYSDANIPIYKFEDFCRDPDKALKSICENLNLKFTNGYKEKFHDVRLTGDSGRASSAKTIGELPSRDISENLLIEAKNSPSFTQIKERLKYTNNLEVHQLSTSSNYEKSFFPRLFSKS
jgi:hypothetical protein